MQFNTFSSLSELGFEYMSRNIAMTLFSASLVKITFEGLHPLGLEDMTRSTITSLKITKLSKS